MNLTIGKRLTISFSFLFAGLLLLFSWGLYTSISNRLFNEFKAEMIHDGRLIEEIFKEELKLGELVEFVNEIQDFDIELLIHDESNNLIVQSIGWSEKNIKIPDDLEKSSKQFNEIKLNGHPHIVFTQTQNVEGFGKYIIHTVRSLDGIQSFQRKLMQQFFIWLPGIWMLSLFTGYIFSKRALRPVEDIRRKAESIQADNLTARLPVPPQRDELQHLTKTLNKALDRIQDSFEKLKRFTADASHELRIPITALRGTLEVALRKERPAEEYRESLEDALEEAERLSRLAQDLLLLARFDSKQVELNRIQTPIGPFLEDIAHHAKGLSEPNDIQLKFLGAPNRNISVDPDRFRQLLLNIIDNAVKYNRPGGKVEVGARQEGNKLEIFVKDTGVGIPESDTSKVFDRFYRADKARSRQMGGTGLGLSIAKGIVTAHNGKIWIKTQPNQGTTVTIQLPIDEPN